ncbi:hypothetical protein Ancab_032740 [Ancistrocladus abbreviatus]
MKLAKSRRSRAAAVHHHQSDSEEEEYLNRFTSSEEGEGPCTTLTVWRKSLLYCCTGFTVIGADGDLVYRVDNYKGGSGEVVLMDSEGKPIFTIRHHYKKLILQEDWLVYEGEADGRSVLSEKKPSCCVKRQSRRFLRSNSCVLARVFLRETDKRPAYVIEGCYGKRACMVVDKLRNRIVAEMKTKEAGNGGTSFGSEVFQLIIRPGFDANFAMTMVLLLDQMFAS